MKASSMNVIWHIITNSLRLFGILRHGNKFLMNYDFYSFYSYSYYFLYKLWICFIRLYLFRHNRQSGKLLIFVYETFQFQYNYEKNHMTLYLRLVQLCFWFPIHSHKYMYFVSLLYSNEQYDYILDINHTDALYITSLRFGNGHLIDYKCQINNS